MSEQQALSFDVTVVGGGVAGLMLTRKLAELGLETALIERGQAMAEGPSTRNEGWLHRGTYHATSIADRATAMQVARRCIYGHEQIKQFAPEAIEDIDLPSYALVRDPDSVGEIVDRWEEAGVQFNPVLLDRFAEDEPNVRTDDIAEVFRVEDLGINTRLLYRKLLATSQRAGAQIFTGSELEFRNPHEAEIDIDGERQSFDSRIFVYTMGYKVKEFFRVNFDTEVPLRYWKSHLIVSPRLTGSSVFCLDPFEAAMMNHEGHSITGRNEDAVMCEIPDYETTPNGVEGITGAMRRLFYNSKLDHGTPVACIKTDLLEKSEAARSLNISISEPLPNHICVLPGKMTEAPYVTDVLTKMVYSKIDDGKIALRPMDQIALQGEE